mgnify:CR=1
MKILYHVQQKSSKGEWSTCWQTIEFNGQELIGGADFLNLVSAHAYLDHLTKLKGDSFRILQTEELQRSIYEVEY